MRLSSSFGRFSAFFVAAFLLLWGSTGSQADTFDWAAVPATNLRTGGTAVVPFGTAPTILNATVSGAIVGTYDGAGVHNLEVQPGTTLNGYAGLAVMRMDASNDTEATFQTITVTFNEPIYDLNLIVGDVDGGPTFTSGGSSFNDIVEFRAVNVAGTTINPTSGTPTDGTKVLWDSGTGRALANGFNVTDATGDITVVFAGPVKSFTVRHYAAANSNVTNPGQQMVFMKDFTFKRSPQLTVNKQALTNTGTFPLLVNNILNVSGVIMTSTTATESLVVGTPGATTVGTRRVLFGTNLTTTITETIPANWALNGTTMACSDSNNAVSGNPATFTASVSGSVVSIDASNIRVAAIITCVVLNTPAIKTLTIAKTWAFFSPGGDVNGNGMADVGDQIVYSYQVQNTGNVIITSVVVNDVHEGAALPITPARVVSSETLISNGPSGPSTDAATNGTWDTLTPGSVIRFRYTHTVNLTEFTAG